MEDGRQLILALEERLLQAYEAVVSKEMSTQCATEEFGVPRSTLQDRVSGRVALKARTGAKRLLIDNEESALSSFIFGCAAIGYAKAKKGILAIVKQILLVKMFQIKYQMVGGSHAGSVTQRSH